MKGGGGGGTYPEKSPLKKPSFIRIKEGSIVINNILSVNIKEELETRTKIIRKYLLVSLH